MYRRFGILWGLITLVIAGVVGVVAYNLGASSVVTTSAAGEAGRVVYYPGFGFFWIFPLLFLLFIFFGIFGRWGRWYGGGPGGGYGYGDPRSRLDRWHQEAHGTQAPKTDDQSQQGPAGR
jgi:hypothetical protein